jgi:hypothetical protein
MMIDATPHVVLEMPEDVERRNARSSALSCRMEDLSYHRGRVEMGLRVTIISSSSWSTIHLYSPSFHLTC